ncbi:MAG: trehalose-6-phosphate synthase [bacterium]
MSRAAGSADGRVVAWKRGRNLIIVTNREPYVHTYADGDEISCSIPTGGVTAALDPVMQDVGGTWIAWGSGGADADKVDSGDRVGVPPLRPKYLLRRVWLKKSEVRNYYYGYSNEGLWPLAHSLLSKVRFEKKQWNAYQSVNRRFAAAAAGESADNDVVWVHDYHLTLVPGMLKKQNPSLTVAFFWHIPWPQFDVFRVCPQHKQILAGMLAAGLIGFHIPRYCRNFLECVGRTFGEEALRSPTMPRVESFPVSVDFDEIETRASGADVAAKIAGLRDRYNLHGRLVACGVDRMDYTKGVPERLEALEILFDRYPRFRGRFTLLQVCSPSRTELSEYRSVKKRVRELTDRMVGRFATEDWTPVVVFHRKVPFETILALYRMADVGIVSPIADGMNLVAKEFIAAQVDERGVLALSQFAGAAGSIENALKFNPFERDSFAECVRTALEMPKRDKKAMIRRARRELKKYTVFHWVREFLDATLEVASPAAGGANTTH